MAKKKKQPKKKAKSKRPSEPTYIAIDEDNETVFIGSRSKVIGEIQEFLNDECGCDGTEEQKERAEQFEVLVVDVRRRMKIELTFEPEIHFVNKDATA